MNKHLFGKVIITLLFGAYPFITYAQHEFSMDAEYRPRAEVRSGYSKPLSKECDPEFLMLQRVRIGGSYFSKYVKARLTLQDSRVFGQMTQQGKSLTTDKSTGLFLYEAWAELLFPRGFSFRIGRQELNYDDQRLFSKSDWSNTGNAHDLARLMFRSGAVKADLGYAYNNNQTNPLTSEYEYGNDFYRNMLFLWVSGDIRPAGLTLSGLAVREGFQETKKEMGEDNTTVISTTYLNHYRYTYGANIGFNKKNFPLSAGLSAYGQSGETKNGIDLSAFMLALKLDYKIIKPLTFTLGGDWYSGTSASVDPKKKTNTFMGLYGSNHRFNGAIDYWTPTSAPVGGLIDLYLQAKYKINDKIDASGGFRTFRLAKEIAADNGDKGLGHEIDVDLSYKFCKIALIKGGYSCYFCTDLTKRVKGVTLPQPAPETYSTRFSQFAYVSISVFPQLFTYKTK